MNECNFRKVIATIYFVTIFLKNIPATNIFLPICLFVFYPIPRYLFFQNTECLGAQYHLSVCVTSITDEINLFNPSFSFSPKKESN